MFYDLGNLIFEDRYVCVCVCVYVLARTRGNVRCCINTIYFTVYLVFMS